MDLERLSATTQPRRISRWLALALCIGLVVVSGYDAYKFQPYPTDQQIEKAADEIYEAVIRDMLPMQSGEYRGMQLVFDDRLIVGEFPGGDVGWCQADSLRRVQVTDQPPPFDTISDRMYRLLTGGVYRTTPQPEVVESYLRVRCLGGPLSHAFHTDIPKHFVGNGDFRLRDPLAPIAGDPEFVRLFPGASGVFGLSRVGFDREISEALVSTSYVCGGLCGSGHSYFLKKVGGQWIVVSKRTTWVS